MTNAESDGHPLEGLRLDGKLALVTGGSSGIGRAAALGLADAGASVCVQGRSNIAEAEAVADQIRKEGGEAIAVEADVSDPADVNGLVQTAIESLGGVDIALCNAGVFDMADLEATTDEIWHRTVDVNLSGAFYVTRRVVPEIRKRGRKGKLIYTGSIFGPYGVPGSLAYCVTKSALHGMTRALAIELAPDINVNAVAPGNIVTPMNTGLYQYVSTQAGGGGDVEEGKRLIMERYPVGRLGTPEDVVTPIVYLASDAADFVTGHILFVDGGYSAA